MVQTIIRDAEPIMIEEEDLPNEKYREEQDEIIEEVHSKSEAEVTNSTLNETGSQKSSRKVFHRKCWEMVRSSMSIT
ncbi:hypothetical protein [Bacillus velezensis]|uniref:hypothetical protein n=1 Tax=Bacillus velezensis TaxID=492670 RepID=UPI001E353A24|nr:hypothetical protein [Bacillus velezensis]